MKLYFRNLAIGVDQFFNVIFGGAPDRTLSYRVYAHKGHWAADASRILIDGIFRLFGQKEHCRKVYEAGDSHTEEVWK